jgi:hypothetical protein
MNKDCWDKGFTSLLPVKQNLCALTLTYDLRDNVNASSQTRHSLVSLEWTLFCSAETFVDLSRCVERQLLFSI